MITFFVTEIKIVKMMPYVLVKNIFIVATCASVGHICVLGNLRCKCVSQNYLAGQSVKIALVTCKVCIRFVFLALLLHLFLPFNSHPGEKRNIK